MASKPPSEHLCVEAFSLGATVAHTWPPGRFISRFSTISSAVPEQSKIHALGL